MVGALLTPIFYAPKSKCVAAYGSIVCAERCTPYQAVQWIILMCIPNRYYLYTSMCCAYSYATTHCTLCKLRCFATDGCNTRLQLAIYRHSLLFIILQWSYLIPILIYMCSVCVCARVCVHAHVTWVDDINCDLNIIYHLQGVWVSFSNLFTQTQYMHIRYVYTRLELTVWMHCTHVISVAAGQIEQMHELYASNFSHITCVIEYHQWMMGK